MYENQTYETILERSLERIATDVDKSEGSVIMNAIAPTSAEHAQLYIELENLLTNGYADTATREWLIKRCAERGIIPEEATYATLKLRSNMDLTSYAGGRFNLGDLNYTLGDFIESDETYYYYKIVCETIGTEGNKYLERLVLWSISPLDLVDLLQSY